MCLLHVYLHERFTLDCTSEFLKVAPVNSPSTASVIDREKLLLLSFAVFNATVGAEE